MHTLLMVSCVAELLRLLLYDRVAITYEKAKALRVGH